jgi:hypothetical protein
MLFPSSNTFTLTSFWSNMLLESGALLLTMVPVCVFMNVYGVSVV